MLEKFSNTLSWSIDDDVFIMQCEPIFVPLLIIEPDTIIDPGPIFTLPFKTEFLDTIFAHLIFFNIRRLLQSSTRSILLYR